jgi:predicted ATPase/DNA-binding SARP family transcriptional activator
MDNLRILLLGTPEVYYGKQPLRIQRRLLRALLFYLACQKEIVGRNEIILMFWPDDPESVARRNLRDTLSKLRAALPDPDILIVDQDRISLNHARIYVDVLEFSLLVHQTQRPAQQTPRVVPLPEAIYNQMLLATNLWRSSHFLAGANLPATEGFDRWLVDTGHLLEFTRLSLLERLADHAAATGDLDLAIRWIRLALQADELNTDFHYRLLTWLQTMGRRSEALYHCKYLEETYKREEMTLPAALARLCQQVKETPGKTERDYPPVWPLTPNLNLPFVGQAKALKELQMAFQHGGTVTISGEAGSGKTRLVYELYQSIEPTPRLLLAQCHYLEDRLPFQPLIDMMRHFISDEAWKLLEPEWASQLARLLPEIHSINPTILPPTPPAIGEGHSFIFEALRRLFLIVAKGQRTLFFLDDAQWCDGATLEFLAYLWERNFFVDHGLLVVAKRLENENPYVDDFINRPRPSYPPLHISVEPLNQEEICELAGFVLGAAPSAGLLERLARDSGGNPLFLLETLRALMELSSGPEITQVVDRLPLASSIHVLMRERLRVLNPQARQVLTAAAIIGDEFTPDILEIAVSRKPEQIVQALEDLEHAHLLRPMPQMVPGGGFAFIHSKIREVLLTEISLARKRVLHLRVARALEERSGGYSQHAALLAQHFEAAGELQPAFKYWLKAAQYALKLLSYTEAIAAYRRAEGLLQQTNNSLPDQDIYPLYSKWGEMAFEQFDLETMQRVYATMISIGNQRQSSLLCGGGLSGLAQIAILQNQPKIALKHIEDALNYLEQAGSLHELIEAYSRLGMLLATLARNADSTKAYERALELGKGNNDPWIQEALINAEYQLALVYNLTGWPEKAKELAMHSLETSQRLFYSFGVVNALSMLGISLFYLGKYREALESCDTGFKLAAVTHNPRAASWLHLTAARCQLATGNLDESWQQMELALQLGMDYSFEEVISLSHCIKGDIYRNLHYYSGAITAYKAGMLGEAISFQYLDNQFRLGISMGLNGDDEKGVEIIQQAIGLANEAEMGIVLLPAKFNLAMLKLKADDLSEAHRLASEVEKEVANRALGTLPVVNQWILGVLASKDGNNRQALEYARFVIERSAALENPWMEIYGHSLVNLSAGTEIELLEKSKQRILQIGEQMALDARRPEVQPFFEAFRQNLLTEFN